jgi:hypothetical protein
MYENIRKPGLLKNIPLIIIRGLPSLYYYGKFGCNYDHEKCEKIFHQNLNYLKAALKVMKDQIEVNKLGQIIDTLDQLNIDNQDEILPAVEHITTDLSDCCSANIQKCRDFYKENKQKLIDLYREQVTPLRVLITDIQADHKILRQLCDFCYYDVQHTSLTSEDYPTMLSKNDFVILTNLDTSSIHYQIEQIDNFQKPAMIVTAIDISDAKNKTAVRHAMQLIRRGFPVIFKILTPIRLFTSIEKTYLKYHAQPVLV